MDGVRLAQLHEPAGRFHSSRNLEQSLENFQNFPVKKR